MTQTTPTQQRQPAPTGTGVQPAAPSIALRKSCNPNGVGLSHYVLMDRKAAK
ncbi:MAG TPA: modified peptide precursor CbpA [Candidatus Binataceae bacterium]|nr:modified peptide precursor CbpA [Candidatus Binataceae bacterium]